jgi:DNA modification methylase
METTQTSDLTVTYVAIDSLKATKYNPRKWSEEQLLKLQDSITRFGVVDPILINSAPKRKNIVIGGHMRLKALKALKYKEVPVVQVHIPDLEKEKELNLRLNQNTGEFDFKLLAEFDESFLSDVGFISEDLDKIFEVEDIPETFNLKQALEKAGVNEVKTKKGDVYQLGNHRLMCGESTVEADVMKLMNGKKADMVFTDPPYILDYLNGKKKHGTATEGFGAKRDRRYLETEILPDNFTELWMGNISQVVKEDSHIIVYENWKNIRTIWDEMEKHWKVRNMLVWHLPNRNQGFAGTYKFFSKHDIAMVGTSGDPDMNTQPETELLQNEYETALYATQGKPHWEPYKKGGASCPTDFIDFKASDEKSSGQGVIFGTKPLDILIPYIKVLTKRDDLIMEPFGGSGSTLMASEKMHRTCYIMEKVPAYTEVIISRWEKITGQKAKKLT